MKQQKEREQTIKRAWRKQKPRKSKGSSALLASDAGLTCQEFKPGTRETWKGQAIGFLPSVWRHMPELRAGTGDDALRNGQGEGDTPGGVDIQSQ